MATEETRAIVARYCATALRLATQGYRRFRTPHSTRHGVTRELAKLLATWWSVSVEHTAAGAVLTLSDPERPGKSADVMPL